MPEPTVTLYRPVGCAECELIAHRTCLADPDTCPGCGASLSIQLVARTMRTSEPLPMSSNESVRACCHRRVGTSNFSAPGNRRALPGSR